MFSQAWIVSESFTDVQLTNSFIYDVNFEKLVSIFIKDIFACKAENEAFTVVVKETEISINIVTSYIDSELKDLFREIDLVFSDGEMVKLDATIFKSMGSNTMYSLNKLFDYMEGFTTTELINQLQTICKGLEMITFISIFEPIKCSTRRFTFIDRESMVLEHRAIIYDRESIIKAKELYCNYIGKSIIEFLPTDFYFINNTNLPNKLKGIFNRICLALSLIYLCDTSKNDDDNIEIRIVGYKTIASIVDLRANKYDRMQINALVELYQWVYSSETSIADKLGIARNILSLHVKDNDISSLDSSLLLSARSNYEIYLKRNVEKYIEIANQQALFINDISDNISNISNDFIEGFKRNLTGVVTFIFTTLVLNVISTGEISNIFTKEISAITVVLIILSVAYMISSEFDANGSFKKVTKKYERNKVLYSSIIDAADLNRILDNDSYYKFEKESFENILKHWKNMWIFTNVLLIVMVFILSFWNISSSNNTITNQLQETQIQEQILE